MIKRILKRKLTYVIAAVLAALGYAFTPSAPDGVLQRAAQEMGVRSVETGTLNSVLQKLAHEHSVSQTTEGMSHDGFDHRMAAIQQAYPNSTNWSEIVAMNSCDTAEAAAAQMLSSWRHSPPHWRSLNGSCTYYGLSMVKGGDGWYATGIFCTN